MKAPKKTFSIRMSDRQRAFAEAKATDADLAVSAWITRLIDREMEREATPAPPPPRKPAR